MSRKISLHNHLKLIWVVYSILVIMLMSYNLVAQDGSSATDWQPFGSIIAHVTNGRLILFDTKSEQIIDIPNTLPNNLRVAVWSPDGTMLAGTDYDNSIYIWELINGALAEEPRGVFSGFEDVVNSIAWNSTGEWLAATSWSGSYTLQVLNTHTFQPILRAHTGNTYHVSWNPLDATLMVATIGGLYFVNFAQLDKTVSTDHATFPEFLTIARRVGPADAAVSVVWSPDGTEIASSDFNGIIRVIRASEGVETTAFENEAIVTALDWSGNYLASAVRGDGIYIWNVHTKQIVEYFSSDAYIPLLSFSAFGGRLAFGAFTAIDDFPNVDTANTLQIVVPAPSLERLHAIAQACRTPLPIEQSLSALIQSNRLDDFIVQVEALPEGTIPPACAADLLAVAGALREMSAAS